MARRATSISLKEVSHFSALAGEWWNPDGAFRILHRLNPLRVEYVKNQTRAHFVHKPDSSRPFQGLRILDVGCGGGLLAEPLVHLGAKVTGLDASSEAIAVAVRHAKTSGLSIEYRTGGVEDLAKGKERFDIITAFEIIEHVADLDSFLAAVARLLKPGGMLILATLNRTPQSFLLGIVAAEYVLGWVPCGTHQWTKFVRPSELVRRLEAQKITTLDLSGVTFDPLAGTFGLSKDNLRVNYFLTGVKNDGGRIS